MNDYPVALTIAGSDSGGGAGIQADLRTFAFHRVHGASAITCITAQNTLGVTAVEGVRPSLVGLQITSVARDLKPKAVKLGMLYNQEIMQTVISQVREWNFSALVVDPVMVSRTGAKLIDEAAITTLAREIIPLALIVTPNRYEAQILSGLEIQTWADMEKAAEKIYNLGAKAVLVKGGAMAGELQGVDLWFDGQTFYTLKTTRVLTKHNHGTGCTLSAAIAANLALGKTIFQSVVQAKEYLTEALKHSLKVGQGHGPVGHFFPLDVVT
ncbi:bifunctional hydroxymethylpyrimidine kinase/phosphomethylpyrimidine kinase [Gloeocapsa sp. PCC 73106]|uniref:bifunctional hydroxymethylpyrimidine kinase/phosphomethylpyrimidine kinase n=1 Tax=Gloeocapsa sp. PCC 73106 TaxID=102232 RepID=UPI0002ACF29E|nr:bifunctional hydroxymethylpyrimidine kinase/phosphomethylpyrimidine kinase [Gloeocapsa sp. PCC 73106]ELR98956.1 phosphomethylpyrimidine kinase [Gloeocapsa sp. PCC 73106]